MIWLSLSKIVDMGLNMSKSLFNRRRIIIALGVGAIAALLTGFLPMGERGGVNWWGFPSPWISRYNYPGATDVYHWPYLLLDWLILSALIFIIYRVEPPSKKEKSDNN